MKRRLPFFYGWLVVALSAVGLLFGEFPLVVSSFGIFFASYIREFHAGRAAISLAFSIHNFIAAFAAPIVGRLADGWGARRVVVTGLCMLGLILLSARAIGSSLWGLYVFYAALGFLGGSTSPLPYSLIVSRWFNRRRGLALGLMMTGTGTGAILIPAIAHRLITTFGWRNAFAIAGALILIFPAPLISQLFKESPERMGLLPDGETSAGLPSGGKASEGLEWREIRRSGTFWWMILAFGLVSASVHGCYIHLAEMLTDRGSGEVAAAAISAAGFALFLGRAVTGCLLDRYFAPRFRRSFLRSPRWELRCSGVAPEPLQRWRARSWWDLRSDLKWILLRT